VQLAPQKGACSSNIRGNIYSSSGAVEATAATCTAATCTAATAAGCGSSETGDKEESTGGPFEMGENGWKTGAEMLPQSSVCVSAFRERFASGVCVFECCWCSNLQHATTAIER